MTTMRPRSARCVGDRFGCIFAISAFLLVHILPLANAVMPFCILTLFSSSWIPISRLRGGWLNLYCGFGWTFHGLHLSIILVKTTFSGSKLKYEH